MQKKVRTILFVGIAVFLLIQMYQPARNKDNGQLSTLHFSKMYKVPDSLNIIITNSCYDCHSNNTRYPWYAYIQPARLIMEWHIKKGKKELNFSEFGNYSKRRQDSKLEGIIKQVKSGEMPLFSYTILHRNSKLTQQQKRKVLNWIDSISKNNE